jgi:hypothetical protein
LRNFCLQGIRSRHAQVCQHSHPAVADHPTVIDDFLKLAGRGRTLSGSQVCLVT